MTIAKDYFGHEINKGDVVLYNERASKGYYSSFTEGIVVGFNKLSTVSVIDHEYLEEYKTDDANCFCLIDRKFPKNVINLTALRIRERVELD